MSTEFPFVKIPPELAGRFGKPDEGTRMYRVKGSYENCGRWYDALHSMPGESFVSPGGVSMYVPVSRAAVHKRMKQGKLTAFLYQVTHKVKTFWGTEREARTTPFVYIPVSECKAWTKEIEQRSAPVDPGTKKDLDDTFLREDPEDGRSRKVFYTDEYTLQDQLRKWQKDLEGGEGE